MKRPHGLDQRVLDEIFGRLPVPLEPHRQAEQAFGVGHGLGLKGIPLGRLVAHNRIIAAAPGFIP